MGKTKKQPTIEGRVKAGYIDLTKTGPLSYRELRSLNNGLPEESVVNAQRPDNIGVITALQRAGKVNYTEQPTGLGESIYDPGVANQEQIENLQDYRAEAQPWYAKIGAGLTKGVVLAGTTFLDGTIGLLVGGTESINRGDISGLWDNDFSKAMQAINEWSEEALPNYYSQNELNSPWYENIFTANFLGDKFIKNLGFSIGAIYSGGVYAAPFKAAKIANAINTVFRTAKATPMVSSAVGSILSAVNEGRVEALNNSKDWFELQKQQLDDWYDQKLTSEYKPLFDETMAEYNATKGTLVQGPDGSMYDPAYLRYKSKVEALQNEFNTKRQNRESDKVYSSTLSKITEDRLKMGNADLLMNIPILTASNLVQFGKFFGGGYRTARKTTNIAGRAGNYTAGTTKLGTSVSLAKGALSEGLEEISQKAASVSAGNYYATDVSNWYKSQIDPNAEKETLDWMKSIAQGVNETVNDGSSWEEFFIGTLTGALGIPTFRSPKSSDGSFRSPIVMQGGAYNGWKEYQQKVAREQEIADYMNSRVQSPEFLNYYQGLIRHNKYQADMNKAVEEGNEFDFKNAEHAQLISDIVMFDNAGKLGDLEALIGTSLDTSEENLESIVRNTTAVGENNTPIGPFAQYARVDSDGQISVDFGDSGVQEMTSKLNNTREEFSNTIKNYVKIKDDLDVRTGEVLSDEQLQELTWMKSQLGNWTDRATAMSGEVKQVIGKVIGNLDSFIRFQDTIRTEEGMNNANLTDRYNRADKNVRDAQRAVASLNAIRNLDDVNLAATLARNPDFVKGLMKEVTLLDDTVIKADEREDVLNKLSDIVKLGNAADVYNAKFKEYLSNPGQQVADHERANQETAQVVQKENNASLRQKLDQATSVAQFREILSSEQDAATRDAVLQTMESEDNQIAKNYRETLQYNNELSAALNELGETDQVAQDAMTLWKEQFNIAENLEQLANPNTIFINNEEAFMEDSGGDVELAGTRFENARYALQRAMSKVNNDIKFKNRFSEEYRKPVDESVQGKGTDKDETGDSGTPTVPHVNPGATPVEVPSAPVGNVTAEMVASENSDANKSVKTQRDLDRGQQGQRKYYRPAIPELHIEASKEGDFRPFDTVVAEREQGVDFSGIYSYLRDNGAFNYVNAAKLKPGDTLGFMIDPEFNDHTIFLVDTRNNQIVGSIDESDTSVARYEGLENLIKKVRDEYQASRKSDTVGGSPVALSYLLENGVGTIESAGYFLHAIAAAFPVISEGIESMSDSLDGDVLGMKPDAFVSSNNPVIKRIETFIKEYYGEEGVNIYSDLLKNSTGFVPAEGKQMDTRIEKLVPLKDAPRTATTRFFATPQVRVSKIMVGRIPYTSEERSLADIPGVIDGDTKPIFGIIKNGVLTTNEKIDDILIIKPVDMAQKEGRLYLLIPNAAGTYSPVAVRVKHFNTQEFNLADATVANTPVGKGINEALDRLADAASQDDVSIAMKELAQDIYMQDVMITWFDAKAGSGIVVSKKVRKSDGTYEMVTINGQEQIKEEKTTIYFQSSKKSAIINGMEIDIEAAKEMGADLSPFGQPRDTADIRKDILNTILRYNLPLQVDASMINKSSYNNRLIKSNILTSNLREAKVIGSWFITDYFNNQGNLQRAVSPASVKPAPSRKVSSPVGGTEGVVQGTRVIISGTPYIVDLKSNMAINEKTGEKRAFSAFNSQSLIDMAWAQETFGDATESSRMTENKIITPNGDVLDRSTGHYITGDEAQRIKDKIAGKNKETESRIAQSKRIIADIYENQKKVDKARTDKDYYYILEEDGQYHQYSRVHSRLGDNWLGERTETENSRRALEAGTVVDKVIRDFFTSKETPTRPETLSEDAFIDLITKLTEIKSKIEQMGETFMTNNIVLFQKYADGTRVAGEVDILSVDKNGNFKIYDVKTSRYSFSDKYFNEKSSMQRMSTKDYYTLQLSAYQNLFESQYGVRPTRLAIFPFVLSYNTVQATAVDIPSGTQTRLGLPIAGNRSYFRTDRKVDDNEARFVSSEKDGKVYFKPILDTKAHEATLKSTDAAKSVVEFTGGDPKEATHFVLVEPGEATRNPENGRLMVSKKVKVFAVTPSTPYSNRRSIVTSITQEKGIPITYNPAVNVPLASAVHAPATSSNLPIFDSTMETMITNPKEQNRVLPENAFEEGGEIGYYEKDGKLYTGYLKKIGEVEVTYGSGRKDIVPIHVTKVRDTGFGREGEFGSTSEYLTVFPNGKAISTKTNDTNDAHAAEIIMKALSTKPEKVLLLSSEKTQIHNPRELEESDAAIRIAQETTPQPQGGASRTVQKENAVNQKAAKRTRHKLRAADSTRPIWDREKEMSWLEKTLPQLSEQDRVKVVEGLIQVAENGPVAWGMFSDGIVTLSDIAAEGTAYHEAFHVVFNLMMNDSERESLFNEARQMFGNKSLLELEEDMAEGFREYVVSQETRSLGRKILDFFKNLFAKITNWKYIKPSLTSYYRMINQGKYKNYSLGLSSISRLREEQYTSEMQSIKDKAIADGTFMKAPNGNPTNLTDERQWLQVRTKAFKEWFGDWENNPNEASKVVDENDEPLVVYHGTKNNVEISKVDFSKSDDLISFFTTNDKYHTANSYTESGINTGNSNLDTIIENIIEYDGVVDYIKVKKYIETTIHNSEVSLNDLGPFDDERSLKEIIHKNKELLRYLESNKDKLNFSENTANIYSFFESIKKPLVIDVKDKNWNEIKFEDNTFSTREIAKIANERGYDGVIFKNIRDLGAGMSFDGAFFENEVKHPNVYISFKSNQIKSATSNTGKFSTTNDDIRYREVDINDSEFKDLKQDLTSFFSNFGITIEDTSKFDSEEPIFNALDRVINFNSIESLTDNAGYAIAFMMQYNPKIKDLISIKQLDSPVKMKGLRRAVNKGKRYDFRNLTEREYKSLNKTPYLKEIGKDIGEQLRLLYSKKPINTSDSFFRKLWSAISEFFKKMTPETRLKFSVIRNYTNSIANAVKLGDYTIIRKSDFKPGTDTLPSIVDIGEAFKNNPYEESIVYTLNKHGISLAGEAAIASQGTLYRPSENPLHDLDFEAGNKSKGEIESILRNTFKAYSHTNTIVNENGRVTYTYLVMDREFEERRDVPGIGVNVIYDKKTGERLGTRMHSELVIEKEGVKGKMLDFFTGDTTNVFDNVTINYNGKNYLFSDYRNAMSFKINVARLKNIWDYNRFIPRNENGKIVSLAKLKNSNKERVQNLVRNARIIWGHPAIGKTTYLERNNDILEWDKEVNPKRDIFVRDQIDPNYTMDVNSTEYKRLKQEYMSNWENNSEYIKFLTREWNKLKDRAQRENKRLFASPLPLLSIFRNDFDLIVALPEKQFIERNKARGGSEVGSLSWKQALDRQLVGIDTNKIVYTDKYFSEFMRDTLGVTWGTLNNTELEALQARGWSEEKFNSISQVERDNAIECAGL